MLRTTPHSILHFFTRTLLPLLLLCAVLGMPVVAPAGEPAAKEAAAAAFFDKICSACGTTAFACTGGFLCRGGRS